MSQEPRLSQAPRSEPAEFGSEVERRLYSAFGLTVPTVSPPLASYVPAVRVGELVFTSGQLPLIGGLLMGTGKVGAEVAPESAHEMAARAALNAIAALRALPCDLDTVVRVVKVVGFVASTASFTGQAAVINGASDLLGQAFGAAGIHARSAVGVAVLPLDAPVEVEVVFQVSGDN